MKKILHLLALFCLLAIGTGAVNAETYTLELTTTSLGIKGNSTNYTKCDGDHVVTANSTSGATMSVTVNTSNVCESTNTGNPLQFRKNEGKITNTTDLGKITNIVVSKNGGTDVTTSYQDGFFTISAGSNAGYVDKITITFEIDDSTEQPGQGGEGGGSETPTPGESPEVTFDFSNPSEFAQGTFEVDKGTIINDFSSGNVKFHIDQASGATETQKLRFYNVSDFRCSSAGGKMGHKFTISTIDGSNIIKIEFTGSKNAMTASPEKLDGYNWTGKASSVTFTTTDQVIFTKIKVIYEVPQTGPVEFKFDPNIPAELQVGETYILVLLEPLPNNFEIISEENTIATVSDDAPYVITAVSPGTANFTATWDADENYTEGEKDFSIEIIAKKSDVTTFAYSTETANFDLAENAANDPLPVLYMDPQGLTVTFTSSDEKVASVSENGEVTPLAVGETIITATFAGNEQYNGTSASYTLFVTDSDAPAEKGTKENPYSVSDIKDKLVESGNAWVVGYIIGSAASATSLNTTDQNTNIAIADDPNETKSFIPVKLAAGDKRNKLNVVDNPTNKQRNIKIYGTIGAYFGVNAISDVIEYEFLDDAPGKQISDISVKINGDKEVTRDESITISNIECLEITATNATKITLKYFNVDHEFDGNFIKWSPIEQFNETEILITASNKEEGLTPKDFSFKLTVEVPVSTPYELVTSDADLIENAHYVIAAKVDVDRAYAMSNESFSNTINGKLTSIENSFLNVTDDMLILKLGKYEKVESEEDIYKWTLNFVNYKGNGNGLDGQNNSTNLRSSAGPVAIKFDEDSGVLSIVFKSDSSREILFSTSNNNVFRHYASSNKNSTGYCAVSLYKHYLDPEEVKVPTPGGDLKDNNPYITLTANEEHEVYYDVFILDKDYLGYGQESTARRANANRQDGSTQHEGYFLAAEETHGGKVTNSNGTNTYNLKVSALLADARGNESGDYTTLQAVDAADKVLLVSTYAYHAPSAQKSDVIAYALDPNKGTPTGLDSIISDFDSEAQYFNLQGLKVDRPEKGGLYIKVKGGKSSKVVF